MRASTITKTLATADDDGISVAQALAAAGYMTIGGALAISGVGYLLSGRQVIITSGGNDSALTWTVTGTNESGSPIKDSFAGSNGGIATSNLLNFFTVTSVYSNGAVATTAKVGTNGVGASDWKMFADTIATPHAAFDFELLTGSANISVQYTQEPIMGPIPNYQPNSAIALAPVTVNPVANDIPSLSALAASAQGSADFVFHAWRVKINSGTGSVRVTGRQSGLASP